MNNKHNQASDGEAKAKPEVIKLGLDLHARQVTECRQLDGSTPKPAQKWDPWNLLNQVEEWVKARESRSTAVTSRGVWVMVSPRVDQMWSGQLRGGATTVREPTLQTSED
jgi:hypothetical protein